MQLRGTLYMLSSAFLFTLAFVCVKLGARTLPTPMLILARALFTLVVTYAFLRVRAIPPWGVNKKVLLARGFFGTIALVLSFAAITMIPLAEVSVVFNLNPLFVALLALVFLKEAISLRLMLAFPVAFAGIIMVAQPQSLFAGEWAINPWGVLLTIGAAMGAAIAYICVRHLRTTDGAWVIVFWFPLVGVPMILPWAIATWRWPVGKEWMYLLGIGVFIQAAQLLMTKGLSLLPAAQASMLNYSGVVFSAILGAVVFGEVPGAWTYAGGAMVAAALLLVAWPTQKQSTA